MRLSRLAITITVIALAAGSAVMLAATIVGVSATPTTLTVAQGGTGSFTAAIDSMSGNIGNARNAPDVSYCKEWTIHADGTLSCDATGIISLVKRNYSQYPVLLNEYVGQVVVNVDGNAPCDTTYQIDETFTVPGGSGLNFGKDAFGQDLLQVTRTVVVTVPCPVDTPVFDGCSHGYWKNHPTEWPAPYAPGTKLGDVFDLGAFGVPSDDTLQDALGFKGGNTTLDKAKILLRNAVAGLLNSAHPEINYYQKNTALFVLEVNDGLASNDGQTMLELEAKLDAANHGSAFCGDSSSGQ